MHQLLRVNIDEDATIAAHTRKFRVFDELACLTVWRADPRVDAADSLARPVAAKCYKPLGELWPATSDKS